MVAPVRRVGKYLLWFLAVSGAVCWVALIMGVVWRRPIATWALRHALAGNGIELKDLRVSEIGLHHAAVGPVDLSWRGQHLRVGSIVVERPDLLSSSLGRLTVQGLALDVNLAHVNSPATAVTAPAIPRFDEIVVTGKLSVHTSEAGTDLTLAVTAQPGADGKVLHATVALSGASMSAQGTLDYNVAHGTGRFVLEKSSLDLDGSRELLKPLLPAELDGWKASGKLEFAASGKFAGDGVDGKAELHWRNGSVANSAKHLSFDGIQADLVISDLAKLASSPGQTLTMKSARVGDITLKQFATRFQLQGPHRIQVESAKGVAFGGTVSTAPFSFDPSVVDYGLTVRVSGVQVADVLALVPSATASATGEADGEVALRYGPEGLEFGHGWLGLHAGTTGTLKLQEPGLLTGNMPTDSMAYPTLKEVENGLTNLRVTALRVDVHPINAPASRSVQIHVEGQPIDPNVKAPVTFDVNVNGPVEKLIQWGLDSRMNFSPK